MLVVDMPNFLYMCMNWLGLFILMALKNIYMYIYVIVYLNVSKFSVKSFSNLCSSIHCGNGDILKGNQT